MRTRPWPLVILALIQILTPFLNIVFNSIVLKVSPAKVIIWILERPPLEAFQTLALMPIAGFAIWSMKRWSYPIFIAAILWSATKNMRNWEYATNVMPLPLVILVYVFELILVGYFLLPKVRTTYFDPTVRWWESKPRYVLQLLATIRPKGGKDLQGSVLNLSEGGAFVTVDGELNLQDSLEIEFSVLGRPFLAQGKVMHSRRMENGNSCYGIQFSHSGESLNRFKALAASLSMLGFADRGKEMSWHESLWGWFLTLLKTGQGWLPEPQYRKRDRDEKKSA